ncbi:hypothetical protein HED60_00385 [Planctomycetales bacterium ZRK34]|nr:hypothetical protein HED60_00385 [Planctomycetales bacterium ZRK34]
MAGRATGRRYWVSHRRLSDVTWFAILFLLMTSAGIQAQEATWQSQLRALQQRLAEQDQRLAEQQRVNDQLRKRLDDQQGELSQMRAREDQSWLTTRRAEEVKALVREVLSDADTRASLADGGMTGGWNNGFFLASEDGNYLLRFLGQIQARYTYSHQATSATILDTSTAPPTVVSPSDDNDRGGFGITRTRFGFKGHVIDPSWSFLLWAGYDCTGNAVLLDAYINKQVDDHLMITAGQFKLPFLKEYMVSETRLQFVERSLIAGEFCGTYTQGIKATWTNDMVRLIASANDGASAINTIWHDRTAEGIAGTGRAEIKLFGDWSNYNEWESFTDDEPMMVIGGAVHYQKGEYGTTDRETEDARWTVDASLEMGGWNIYSAIIGENLSGATQADRLAWMIQGGCFVTEALELIARYEWGDSDVDGEDPLSVMTVGFNYFIAKHRLKITTDVGYGFRAVAATWASNPLGWRQDAPEANGQIVIRSQIQLLF